MPAYGYLFASGETRGPDLLAYLASLGAGTEAERQAQVAAWSPRQGASVTPAESARMFKRLCSQCHGAAGAGDGSLVPALSLRPPDWTAGEWRHVSATGDLEAALSRIIKFGLPGLPMAGHEYLTDAELVGLARHVLVLHKPVGAKGPAMPP